MASMTLMTTTLGAFILALTGSSATAQCGSWSSVANATTTQQDLVQTATAAGSFTKLLAAAKAAGLVEVLQGSDELTVFAPTDDAFAKLPAEMLSSLLEDRENLARVLTYHVLPGRVPASELVKQSWAHTVQGQAIRVQAGTNGVQVDGAGVLKADIQASNGVIHVIDTVLLPRKDIVDIAVGAGSFKSLVQAVTAAGLVDTLKGKGPFTVFAPNDGAFGQIPAAALKGLLGDRQTLTGILTYHVVPGRFLAGDVAGLKWLTTVQGQSLKVSAGKSGVLIDDARILATDIIAGNGVIHVIDRVVKPRPNIVATAKAAGTFTTLLQAAQAAGLAEALAGDGPFTVFAPTDDAFARLPEGTIPALLKDLPRLRAILKLHVIPGRVLAADIPEAKADRTWSVRPATLEGSKIAVTRMGSGTVTVANATVTTADIVAGNGVIHVIDQVILPE